MPRPFVGSVQQQYGQVLACRRGVLILRDGRCRAIVEVTGFAVASSTAQQQDDYRATSERFVGGLTHPLQLLVRTEPVDLDAHAAEIEDRTQGDPVLAPLGADYAGYARALAAERVLLRRRCFVVVPADDGLTWREARQQLNERCDKVAEGFSRMGMPATRLLSADLLTLVATMQRPGAHPVPWSCDPDAPDGVSKGDVLARTRAQEALTILAPKVRRTLRQRVTSWRSSRAVPRRWRTGRLETAEERAQAADEAELLAGTDTFADRVAPAAIRVNPRTLRLEDAAGESVRTLLVTGYPGEVVIGWLAPLLTLGVACDLSMHITPKDKTKTVNGLRRRLIRLQGAQRKVARGEAVADPDAAEGIKQLEKTLRALTARDDEPPRPLGRQRLFDVAVYLSVRGPSETALGDTRVGLQARVEGVLEDLQIERRVAVWQQPAGFEATLPLLDDGIKAHRALDTSSLARSLPFVTPTGTSSGILIALDKRNGSPLLWDAFNVTALNASLTVVAPPGAGKSFFAKLLALRHLYLGVDCWIVDPEGEYRRLAQALGAHARLLRFGTKGGCRHLNLFDLPPSERDPDTGEWSDPVVEQTTAAGEVLEVMLTSPVREADPVVPLPDEQRALLERAILQAYAAAGLEVDTLKGVHLSFTPPPVLRDVVAIVHELPDGGPLAERLTLFAEGVLGRMFSRQTDVPLDGARFLVFDVRDTPKRARPAVLHMVTQWIWAQARRQRRPRLVVVDEAAYLLRTPDGAAFLAEVAKRGRKYWLGLVTMVQDLSHLQNNQAGLDVLRSAASVLLLRHRSDALAAAETLFSLSKDERDELLAAGKGEGVFLSGGDRVPVRITASALEHRLVTTRPDEVREIEAEDAATFVLEEAAGD